MSSDVSTLHIQCATSHRKIPEFPHLKIDKNKIKNPNCDTPHKTLSADVQCGKAPENFHFRYENVLARTRLNLSSHFPARQSLTFETYDFPETRISLQNRYIFKKKKQRNRRHLTRADRRDNFTTTKN